MEFVYFVLGEATSAPSLTVSSPGRTAPPPLNAVSKL